MTLLQENLQMDLKTPRNLIKKGEINISPNLKYSSRNLALKLIRTVN